MISACVTMFLCLKMLKILILLSLFFCSSNSFYHDDGGSSTSYFKQDDHGNFVFHYHIIDKHGAKNYRTSKGSSKGKEVGSYGFKDSDGRMRVIDYVADNSGFKANIRSNEPGIGEPDSADAIFNGKDSGKISVKYSIAHKTNRKPKYHK